MRTRSFEHCCTVAVGEDDQAQDLAEQEPCSGYSMDK